MKTCQNCFMVKDKCICPKLPIKYEILEDIVRDKDGKVHVITPPFLVEA